MRRCVCSRPLTKHLWSLPLPLLPLCTASLQLLGELQEALDATRQALQQLRSAAVEASAAASNALPAASTAAAAPAAPAIVPQTQLPAAGPMAAVAAAAAGLQQGRGQGAIGRQAAAGAAGAVGPQMHPRNKYASELPDFAALAEQYPALQPYLQVSLLFFVFGLFLSVWEWACGNARHSQGSWLTLVERWVMHDYYRLPPGFFCTHRMKCLPNSEPGCVLRSVAEAPLAAPPSTSPAPRPAGS